MMESVSISQEELDTLVKNNSPKKNTTVRYTQFSKDKLLKKIQSCKKETETQIKCQNVRLTQKEVDAVLSLKK